MMKILLMLFCFPAFVLPTGAVEIQAPRVPASGQKLMPEATESFGEGLWELLQKVVLEIRPDLMEASQVMVSVIAVVTLISVLQLLAGEAGKTADMAGAVAVSVILLSAANSMIRLGAETVQEMSDYGKLLFPVMTAAMAAQGGITSSTALYMGTAIFDSILGSLIARMFVPMVYFFLALAVANGALQEDFLKKMRDTLKGFVSWCLKTLLTVYTTYMGISGVVSGTTDAAALKAAKVTISTAVPVVGGILSDASESILVSTSLIKNTAGLYGIFAVLAVFLEPFLKIGAHYLLLKGTAAVSSVFGSKNLSDLIGDFSAAMGLLLAMTGSVCLLLLISTVCFMKGVG